MANKNVNLNTIYQPRLLVPWYAGESDKVIKGGRPLYAVSATSAKDDTDGELEQFKIKSAEWEAAANSTYSSPTNVRRIFLGEKYVIIHTYKPIIKNGKSTGSLSYLKNVDTSISNAISDLIYYYKGEADIAYADLPSDLVGQPLKYIYRPWVLSNIEEIYIDKGLLLSDKVIKDLRNLVINAYQTHNMSQLSDKIRYIFKALMGDVAYKEGLPKMRRLKYLGIVSSIDETFKNTELKTLKDSDGHIRPYAEAHAMANNLPNTTYCIFDRLAASLEDISDFTVRSYYKFDTEFLGAYARDLRREVVNNQVEKAKIAESNRLLAEERSKTVFESTLDKSYAQDPMKAAIALNTILRSNARDVRQQLYDSLTSSGKQKYGKLFDNFIKN